MGADQTGHEGAEQVIAAATAWRDRCFIADGSIFTEQSLWTRANLDELYGYFVGNPIEGTDQRFYDKLAVQIEPAPAAVKRLAAEAVWFILLFCHSGSVGPNKKREHVHRIWDLAGTPLDDSTPYLQDEYLRGIGSAGTAYLTGLPKEFGMLIDVVRRWKARPSGERILEETADGAWRVGEWIDSIEGASARPIRNVLLYFLFPDFYERAASATHRRDIYASLHRLLPQGHSVLSWESRPLDYDRALLDIRHLFEVRLNTTELDFYRSPLDVMWDNSRRENRRKKIAVAIDGIVANYNLEISQPGIKKNPLSATRPTNTATGFWQNPNDATNKPLRWLLHLDLTLEPLVASVPLQHGAARICAPNTAQGKCSSVLVRIIPVMKVADDRFEFFDTWEWLFSLSFLPALPEGSSAQLLEFDPSNGIVRYKGQPYPYISAALISLNDADSIYVTIAAGVVKQITCAEATQALAKLLKVVALINPNETESAGEVSDA